MKLQLTMAFGALLWIGQAAAWGGQATLKWAELGPRVTGKKVALVLPDGTRVEGKVRMVEAAGLRIKISKTSDRRAQPKGLQVIPRRSVSVLSVTEYRKIGRLLVTVGAVATAAAISAAEIRGSGITEGIPLFALPLAATVGTVGVGIGGYHAGKALDKRTTEIRVAPED
jgi:hypothetical protein